MSKKQEATFSTTVCGMPCGVVVDSFQYSPPSRKPASLCSCPDEYYGHTDMEWHLIDRKGYQAGWLQEKMSDNDIEQLTIEIEENYHE